MFDCQSIEGKYRKSQKDNAKLERLLLKLESELEEKPSNVLELEELKVQHEKEMSTEVKFRKAIADAHATQVCEYSVRNTERICPF